MAAEPSLAPVPAPERAEPAPGPTPRAPGVAGLLPAGGRRAAVVAVSAVLTAASFVRFGLTGHALLGAVLVSTLVLLAAIDIEHRVLPNAVVLPVTALLLAIEALAALRDLPSHAFAGLALGGFFLVLALLYPAGLGMGDVKLGLLLGVALGRDTLGGMLVAFAAVFVAAVAVLVTQGLSARRRAIPFGPFLALGGIVAFLLS